jgi:hypothetical protein
MTVIVERRRKTFSGPGKRRPEGGSKPVAAPARAERPTADANEPTPERLAKIGREFTRGEGGVLVARGAPLEALHAKSVIDERQYGAGKKFYHHWYRSALSGRYAALNLATGIFGHEGFSGGMPATEDQAYHREAYRKSVQHLGMRTSALLQYLVCDERPLVEVGRTLLGWTNDPQARAAAAERLKDALDRLADFYGM